MANSNYWRRRAERLEKQIHSGDRVPISRIMRLYKHAFDEIEDDIKRTMSARDELNRIEVEDLKAEMIRIGASAPDPIRQAQITRAVSAYDYRIDRMEWLKSRAYMHLMKVAGAAAAIVKPHLENTYRAARYGTIDDIAKGLNVGIDFSLIPKRTIERVVKSPFHGKNYSQRVWDNTAETAAKAQKIIVEGLIKGSSYPHMAQELARVTNNTYYNAYRLVQTETTHFTEMGRFDAYKDIGIEKYTYYATLGSKTCDVCAALDGKTFNIDEGIEGKNKPPIHPHCMCYTVIGDVKLTSRLARDPETGKNYKVRGDMTYNEWYEGLSQEKKTAIKAYKKNVDKSKKSGIIKNAKEKSEVPQLHYIGKIDKRIYSCITKDIRTDEVIITDNRIQHIIERRGQEFYDKYKNVFSEIISDPDYVFKDKMPNTAIAAKTFESENSSINIVLRLIVEGEDETYKNSIITAIKESDKRFRQRLRNNDVLYKKLDIKE